MAEALAGAATLHPPPRQVHHERTVQMVLTRFDPPANVPDFPDDRLRSAWDRWLTTRFDNEIREVEATTGPGNSQFFNPRRTDAQDPVERTITWLGFPKLVLDAHPDDEEAALAEAETLISREGRTFRPQDEYLEWHVTKEGEKVVRVDFTCEGPEYWETLADGAPEVVLRLYREHVSPDVQLDDLFDDRGYDRWNRWNTLQGAMHLCQPNNTLSAEINIAAQATILRTRDGEPITDDNELIECAQFGAPGRASDPVIGGAVNALAREGYRISLLNPIGLYMDLEQFSPAGWTKPDGTPVDDYWIVERGTRDRALRAVYEVPRTEGFAVGDLLIGGEPIRYGGQIAKQVTMKLTGVAFDKGSVTTGPVGCVGEEVPAARQTADLRVVTGRLTA